MRRSALVMGLCLALTLACAAGGKIIYVDDDGNAPGDGKSWVTAYRYLQDALADAKTAEKPVEIWVTKGVYKPDRGAKQTPSDRRASFELNKGVSLKGGYAGLGVVDPNSRDITLRETILSGDLTENDVDVNDPCDLEDEPSRAENSYHVVRAFMLEDPVVLEQVTITGGNADGDPPSDRYKGGGLLCESSRKLQVLNCTFRENFADTGGGMFNYNSDPEVTSCSFIGNAAARAGGLGGGMAGAYHSNPTVSNCTFSGNYSARGGAVNYSGGEAMFSSCDFTRNLAGSGGAGYINYGTILFEQCKFSMNSASVGGALATGPIHCDLAHCVLAANSAALSGGAIYMQATDDLTVTNCTFSDNAAPQGRAFSLEFRASILRVASSILWDAGQEISNANNSPVSVTYTNLFGGWPGVGNIDADPLFADPSGGDYHLKSKAGRWHASSNSWILDDATSPCIDAGDPSAPIGLEPFPNGGRINIGPYGGTAEASKSYFGGRVCGTIIAGDVNGDCHVDFVDLAMLARNWLRDERAIPSPPPPSPPGDRR